jgi:hypothetical protein
MRRNTGDRSAAVRTRCRLANKVNQASDKPKMINLKALKAAGQSAPTGPVFLPEELQPHGDIIEKGIHAVGAPLSRWRLIAGLHEITGTVHRADGPAAGDGDTNFELVIPKFDPASTPANPQLSDQAKKINARIDASNQSLSLQASQAFLHIEDAGQNQLPGDEIGIHCEVDASDLDAIKDDLAGMMIGDCYVISGQLVLDTWHGGLYELHPVQTVDRC